MNSVSAIPQWLPLVTSLMGTFLGGALVIFSNYLSARRQDHREYDRKEERNRAVLSGLFAIRNYLAVAIGDTGSLTATRQAIDSSLRTLNKLVDKVSPDDQLLTISIYDLSLKLDALATAISDAKELGPTNLLNLRVNDVIGALEQLDIMFSISLTMLDENDLKQFSLPETH